MSKKGENAYVYDLCLIRAMRDTDVADRSLGLLRAKYSKSRPGSWYVADKQKILRVHDGLEAEYFAPGTRARWPPSHNSALPSASNADFHASDAGG